MSIEYVSELSYDSVVVNSDCVVLIDFWAPWCGACKFIHSNLSNVQKAYAGKLKVVVVNVDENPNLAERFGIRSIPSLLLLRRGAELGRIRSSSLSDLYDFLNDKLSVDCRPLAEDTHLSSEQRVTNLHAFLSERSVKENVLNHLQEGFSKQLIRYRVGRFDESRNIGSPIAWLLKDRQLSLVEAKLGIPESFAALCEYVFFNFREDSENSEELPGSDAKDFLQNVISAVAPGAELRWVSYQFICEVLAQIKLNNFLEGMVLNDEVAQVVGVYESHYNKLAQGEIPFDDSWRLLKSQCAVLQSRYTRGWDQVVIESLDVLTKTSSQSGRVVANSVMALAMGYRRLLEEGQYSAVELEMIQKAAVARKIAKIDFPEVSEASIELMPELVYLNAFISKARLNANRATVAKSTVNLFRRLGGVLVGLVREWR